ncbi:MAG: MmcQ/YjbR family DNA-binding protein [Aeriscardovia sp.]|nr:MmcQ/YjbR family DNA-binding protein [Aeriscardovia sp.]MBR0405903.1 MmcQ/YjbR family DNA-binding protein [Eggerthellaceae bacterium]
MADSTTVLTSSATISLEPDLLRYAMEQYGAAADNPFSKGACRSLRTPENKWFALFLTAPGRAFGLDAGSVRVMNVKCDPAVLDGLVCAGVPGVHRAWHMNHEKWASVEMSGAAPLDLAEDMLDASWRLVMGALSGGRDR